MAVRLDGGVVLVQLRLQQQKRGNAAHDVRELPGFVFRDIASEHLPLAVAEPFLQHLVSANRVFPDGLRHVAPEGFVIEVNVEGVRAPERRHFLRRQPQVFCALGDGVLLVGGEPALFLDAPARHHDVFFFLAVSPAHCDSKAQSLLRPRHPPQKIQLFAELAGGDSQRGAVHIQELPDLDV